MFSDAPWSKGIIFFVQGNNLKETLFLNLLAYPNPERGFISDDDDDAPTWEQANPFAAKNGDPLGYLDYLTWQNRRILLFPERQGEQITVRQWQVGEARRWRPTSATLSILRQRPKIGPAGVSVR